MNSCYFLKVGLIRESVARLESLSISGFFKESPSYFIKLLVS